MATKKKATALPPASAPVERKPLIGQPLTDAQLALKASLDALGDQIRVVVDQVREHTAAIQAATELADPDAEPTPENWTALLHMQAEPERWLALGRSELQSGLMKVQRAIELPLHF